MTESIRTELILHLISYTVTLLQCCCFQTSHIRAGGNRFIYLLLFVWDFTKV